MLRIAIASALLLAASLVTSPSVALADDPPYEMMKDQVLSGKMDAFIGATAEGCSASTKKELVNCLHARLIQAWPQGDSAATHCASRSDPFEELDCITMTSLGIDLAMQSGESDIAKFLGRLDSDNGTATAEAGKLFGEGIWALCPDGPSARQCRLDEALRKLELDATEGTRCAPLEEDRKMVSCLILSRIRNQVDAATARVSQLAQ
jgi:hypothetical protein